MALKRPCCSSFGRNSTSQGNVSSNCPVHRKNSPSLHLLLAYAHLGGSRALQSIPAVDRTSAANPCSWLSLSPEGSYMKKVPWAPLPCKKNSLRGEELGGVDCAAFVGWLIIIWLTQKGSLLGVLKTESENKPAWYKWKLLSCLLLRSLHVFGSGGRRLAFGSKEFVAWQVDFCLDHIVLVIHI